MTPRERVLKTLQFKEVDRVAFDIMEGNLWGELFTYFREKYNLLESEEILNFLDTDIRWTAMTEPTYRPLEEGVYSIEVMKGPLSDARTISDVKAYRRPDPSIWESPDCAAVRKKWQNHALALLPPWNPLFWTSCVAFGMDEALVKMISEPKIYNAFIRQHHEFYMTILLNGLKAAKGYCDLCWLGDDYASQKALLMSPGLWRRHIKPYLAEQVRLVRDNGMYVIFHSCGAVREILPDLIDIGVNALLVFQTSAKGMEPGSIASEFGGKLAFYGGVDIQEILSTGTIEDVRVRVRANVKAFEKCGGYIVANAHHGVKTIKPENVVAMCNTAKKCYSPFKLRK